MKVDLKGIFRNLPVGSQDYLFHRLNEISRGIKNNVPQIDAQVWVAAYNLRYFYENLPVRRYIVYNEKPPKYHLDQTLLPYVKVVRAYARMSDAQKEDFRNGIQQPIARKGATLSASHANSKQRG